MNLFAASPIGLLGGLTSGRLTVKTLQGLQSSVKGGSTSGLEIMKEILKASSRYQDIMTPAKIRVFFQKPQIVKLIRETGHEMTDELVETLTKRLVSVTKFLDSFAFRMFMKSFESMMGNLSKEIQVAIINFINSAAGQEVINARDITKYLFIELPEELSEYVKEKLGFI